MELNRLFQKTKIVLSIAILTLLISACSYNDESAESEETNTTTEVNEENNEEEAEVPEEANDQEDEEDAEEANNEEVDNEEDAEADTTVEVSTDVEVEADVVADDTTPATDPAEPAAVVKEFQVSGENFKYTMGGVDAPEIRVSKGDTVKITFSSADGFHDFVVDEFSAASAKIKTGETTTLEFTADQTGTFEYYCSVGSHRANGMFGKLIVE